MEPEHIRIILALVMLGCAAYSDIRYRQVRSIVWLGFIVLGGALVVFSADTGTELLNTGISMIVVPVALLVWRFGMFGGADAMAVIALSVLAPGASITGGAITPFSTLLNALAMSGVMMFCNYMRNYIISRRTDLFAGFDETIPRKRIAMLIGKKARNPRFAFPMEYESPTGKKLYLKIQHAERAEYATKPDSWVSLGTPWIILILGGFLVQLFYGDLLFSLMNTLS